MDMARPDASPYFICPSACLLPPSQGSKRLLMPLAKLSFLMGGGMSPDLLYLSDLGRRSRRLANMVLDWPNRHVGVLSDFSQSGCVLVALFIPHLVYGQLVKASTEETLCLEGAHEFPLALT